MIEPVDFCYNKETSINNYYQKKSQNIIRSEIQKLALKEFQCFVNKLRNVGVNVITFKDTKIPHTPDSIFPNNWISMHDDGLVIFYPMCAENRRAERRMDIVNILSNDFNFDIKIFFDWSKYEKDNIYLEGTGSMVLDRVQKICYAAESERTNIDLLNQWCNKFGYDLCSFNAFQSVNGERKIIYHTNVMMSVADRYAIVCLDAIDDIQERNNLISLLSKTGKRIIEISEEQKDCFAGNMLQVGGDDVYLVMSERAKDSLSDNQLNLIKKFNKILTIPLNIIETNGGGSVRCMMAEVFLKKHD